MFFLEIKSAFIGNGRGYWEKEEIVETEDTSSRFENSLAVSEKSREKALEFFSLSSCPRILFKQKRAYKFQ